MNKKLKPLLSSEKMDWGTPQDFFDGIQKTFGKFDVDVCATGLNTKCDVFFGPGMPKQFQNALEIEWISKKPGEGNQFWMNPPYGRGLVKWIDKAIEESKKGATVVVLVPARTDTKWFRKCWHNASEIYFVQGRLKFEGAPTSAPFPSMVVVFDIERSAVIGYGTRPLPRIRLMTIKGEVFG